MGIPYTGLGPPSYGRYIELVPVFIDVLRRSNLKEGEKVVIYTDTKKSKDIVDAYYIAAKTITDDVILIVSTPKEGADKTPCSTAVAAMMEADFMIDLACASWIYTKPYSDMLQKGGRIIFTMSSIDACLRLRPDETNIRNGRTGARLLTEGRLIEVKRGDTYVSVDITGRKGAFQGGLSPDPGDWDNYPSGQVAIAPLEDGANGRLVLRPGDIIGTMSKVLTTQIDITIDQGRITKIEGGQEAEELKAWFEQWHDPNAYVISHIGFGCEFRADLSSREMMQWESYGGNMMIAFGSNSGYFMGGKTTSKAHIDIMCFGCDFIVDGLTAVRGGQFTEEVFM